MNELKELDIANFNCTFGEKDEPMLKYFQNIIFPAFTSNIVRKVKGNEYFFYNVGIVEYEEDELVLYGDFIKDTELEVNTKYDKEKGLINVNERHESAPYSTFIIFLKNHRMVFVKNQKGSPDIRSFRSAVNYIFGQYVRNVNKELSKEERLPIAMLNLVNLPSMVSIEKQFEEVESIKNLKMKLYPLNGEIPVNKLYNEIRKDMRRLGSKTGNVSYNTPDNKDEIMKLINETEGTADPVIKVRVIDGSERTLKSNSFSEKIKIAINTTHSHIEKIISVINQIKDKKELKTCSDENRKNYDELKEIIKKMRY